MAGLALYTAPAAEPLTTAEAKLHLRVVTSADDALIASLIVAARRLAEQETGRQLVTATWELHLDSWPACGVISLPRPPLQSVTHVKYYDAADVLQTLATTLYDVDDKALAPRIVRADGATWPTLDVRPNAVVIRFVAGYGAAGAVPDNVKAAMLLMVGHWYSHREAVISGAVADLPLGVQYLLDPARVWGA